MDTENLFDSNNKLKVNIKQELDENVSVLNTLFDKCGDAVQKTFIIEREQGSVRIHIIYIDGLTDNNMVEETIIKPVSYEWRYESEKDLWESILYREAQTVDIKEEKSFDLVIGSVLKGDTAIFVDGYAKALIMSTKKLPLRGINTNDSEAGMRGPRDSFNEGFRQSTALIRRRIRDSKLKVEQSFIGQRSRTDYAIMYLSDIVKPGLVEDIKERLDKYDIDAIYDSGMAEHLLEETPYSPFPIFQSTTRPDKVAAAITEGRVAIVFDNSPEVIIAPANFNMLLQASDDYYNRWAAGTFARILRYIATFISVTLPGFYVAVTVYQNEIIPTKLLYAISSARSLVTFPIVLEVLIMEFLFELLREAGIRLPGPLGNTIGVVGGLIVGQSAVDAGIVSTMVVIVVALTAIASFAIPNEAFASVFRLLKFFILLTSACFGLYGFILGLLIIAIHLSELTSFGVPYMAPTVGGGINGMEGSQDFLVRSPIKVMVNRPMWAQKKNKRRLKRKEE
ncbi:MAG: spore germination protein [Lachnospiraceae bacterium]|nr:spore germination protein [Lachnospiraceae bacterium]